MRLTRFITLSIFFLLIAGCGGDDPPPGPSGSSESISAINGLFYKGEMGTSTVDKPITFQVRDADRNPLPNRWVYFKRLVGDGAFNSDSVRTNAGGFVTAEYIFNGALGHAEIEAVVRNNDSTTVQIRANTLIPGLYGQGQYILFDDRYLDVKNYNGVTGVDSFPEHPILYVDYENALGVVIMLWDEGFTKTADDTTSVFGVIVNSIYEGKIVDSIGIGSPFQAVEDYFGIPDSIVEDLTPPPAWRIRYLSEGLTFYAYPSDTVINEIHLTEYIIPDKKQVSKPNPRSLSTLLSKSYRLYK